MQVQIESSHSGEANGLRAGLDQRVRFVFRRMQDKVQQIRVSLHDINGPRGGVDKECRVTLKIDGRGFLVVTAQAPSGSLALDNALRRANRSLLRLWQRRRRPLRSLSESNPLALRTLFPASS
jgi:hypothetical protein